MNSRSFPQDRAGKRPPSNLSNLPDRAQNEIKNLGIEDGDFRKVLKPISEEELEKLQLTNEELKKRMEKNENEGQMIRQEVEEKKNEKKEEGIKIEDLNPPSVSSSP